MVAFRPRRRADHAQRTRIGNSGCQFGWGACAHPRLLDGQRAPNQLSEVWCQHGLPLWRSSIQVRKLLGGRVGIDQSAGMLERSKAESYRSPCAYVRPTEAMAKP